MSIKNKIKDEYVIYNHIYRKIKYMPFIHWRDRNTQKIIFDNLIQFIVEERTLYRYTINLPPYHGFNPIYDDYDRNIIDRLFHEKKLYMESKNFTDSEIYKHLHHIKNFYINLITNKKKFFKKIYKDNNNDVKLINNKIVYRDIEIKIDNRIQYLIDKSDVEHVLLMLLRYLSYGMTAQHCSLPNNIYRYLYETFNIRGEGFSSPLNSKLIEYGDTIFCTLFKDTDEVFGSKGPFNHRIIVENQHINFTINPPYMTNVIVMVYEEIMKAFDLIDNEKLLLLVLIPKRKNEGYDKFINCPYLIKLVEPALDAHYMNCNGTSIFMNRVINSLFFISKFKHDIKEEQINKLLEIWNTLDTSGEAQSNFTENSVKHIVNTPNMNPNHTE